MRVVGGSATDLRPLWSFVTSTNPSTRANFDWPLDLSRYAIHSGRSLGGNFLCCKKTQIWFAVNIGVCWERLSECLPPLPSHLHKAWRLLQNKKKKSIVLLRLKSAWDIQGQIKGWIIENKVYLSPSTFPKWIQWHFPDPLHAREFPNQRLD